MARNSIGKPKPNPQVDSQFAYEERERDGFVMGAADRDYGYVDGFRYGITDTGHRHKESALGKYARTHKR